MNIRSASPRSALILPLLLFFLIACERKSKDMAEIKPDVVSPNYTVEAKVSTLAGTDQVAAVSPSANKGPDGAEVYARACAACHQGTGAGVPSVFPPLDGSHYVTSDNTERLAAIMVYGLMGPITVNGVQYNSAMTAQGAILNDQELAAVATYVRGAWSNKAGAVAPELFGEVRKKYGARGPFQIAELGAE